MLAGLVIGFMALGVGVWQMHMSRSRYKRLKKDHDDFKENDRLILDYLRRKFDVRLEGSTEFSAPEMTVSVSKRPKKKPTFLLTLRQLLGKLFP